MTLVTPIALMRSVGQYFSGSNRVSTRLYELEQQTARLKQYQSVQHAITLLIARSTELDQALPRILQIIADSTCWEIGEVWHVNRWTGVLNRVAHWYNPAFSFPAFESESESLTFAWGKGLPGRVWESGKPIWINNVVLDAQFLRAACAKQDGLYGALAVPIRTDGELIGVMTFFSRRKREMDRELLHILDTIGSQIGLFIERKRIEGIERDQARTLAMLEERQRVARDLHDSVTQTLFSANIIAEMLPQIWQRDPEQVPRRLNELSDLTHGALAEMRTLLVELRPSAVSDASLRESLNQLVDGLSTGTIDVNLTSNGDCSLPADVQVAFYRIAQESLNNVLKHSGATEVRIDVCGDLNAIELNIHDNGRGFDPKQVPANHFGLGIMRERAESVGAALRLISVPAQGTSLHLTWRRLASSRKSVF